MHVSILDVHTKLLTILRDKSDVLEFTTVDIQILKNSVLDDVMQYHLLNRPGLLLRFSLSERIGENIRRDLVSYSGKSKIDSVVHTYSLVIVSP